MHMGKNTTSSLLRECIVQGLLLLLQEKPLEDISVKEIVEKAGVNRSTYYRHFREKEEVARYFYRLRLDEALATAYQGITPLDYLAGIFARFLQYREELLLLEKHNLTYLLLVEMNSRIPQVHSPREGAAHSLHCNYHIGGVFNSFRYWLSENMATAPEKLAAQCMTFLPENFAPMLLERRE